MKKSIFTLLLVCLYGVSFALADKSKIPESVLETFKEKFPDIEPYLWEINEEAVYVFFENEGKNQICRINIKGELTESGSFIKEKKVPVIVQKSFVDHFPTLELLGSESYVVKNSEGIKRFLIIVDDDNFRRYVSITAKGKFLRDELFDLDESIYIKQIFEDEEDIGGK